MLKEVAQSIQEHNERTLEQLNTTTTQMQALADQHKQQIASITADHRTHVATLQGDINCAQAECDQLRHNLQMAEQHHEAAAAAHTTQATKQSKQLELHLLELNQQHSDQLKILAQEKELARKVLSECLHLSDERHKEAIKYKKQVSELKQSLQNQEHTTQRITDKHNQSIKQLEQESREKQLLERQLAEISKSVHRYVQHAQTPRSEAAAPDQTSEMNRLRSELNQMAFQNHQLHCHATQQAQESQILQASLQLLAQPQHPTQGGNSIKTLIKTQPSTSSTEHTVQQLSLIHI
eukprot:TRINITY_DN12448_c0_g1_i4.p1 TRINITY_DN12448_c0_g1~~TRINITY_DN12448_c0_g1_i4.p1  ORF type:complete len:294 (+),score=79.32 TRINITY_DN12448_c0_g1_i4:369-1250(+)